MSGLRGPGVEGHTAFLTVTAPGIAGGLTDAEAIAEWNAGAARRWNHLRTLLRRQWPRMEFFRVGEIQKRGAVHYHVLARNVAGLTREKLSEVAVRAGFGFIADVRPLRHAGGAAAYLSKYFLKDVAEWPTGRRVWSCSGAWRENWKPDVGRDGWPRGTYIVRRMSGDVYVSVSPWELDLREMSRLRMLRQPLSSVRGSPG